MKKEDTKEKKPSKTTITKEWMRREAEVQSRLCVACTIRPVFSSSPVCIECTRSFQ